MHKEKNVDIIIIGAGPLGLAIAVRLFLKKRSFLVLEKGESAGANILKWGHVNLFSNWQDCVDSKSQKLLNEYIPTTYSPDDFPTGNEFVNQYIKPLANLKQLKNNILLNSNVVNINFDNTTKDFTIIYHKNNVPRIIKSKVVIDASGTWGNFNKLIKNQDEFFGSTCFGIPNSKQIIDCFQNSTIAIIGNGHSAMNSIDFVSQYSNAKIYWVLRNEEPRFGKSKVGGKSEKLEDKIIRYIEQKRIQLITNFRINEVFQLEKKLNLVSENGEILLGIDYLIQNIGANAYYGFLDGISLDLDNTFNSPKNLANKIDPKLHTCNTLEYSFQDTLISEIDYYVVGMKSFGKASNFLLSSGYKILDELINHINLKK